MPHQNWEHSLHLVNTKTCPFWNKLHIWGHIKVIHFYFLQNVKINTYFAYSKVSIVLIAYSKVFSLLPISDINKKATDQIIGLREAITKLEIGMSISQEQLDMHWLQILQVRIITLVCYTLPIVSVKTQCLHYQFSLFKQNWSNEVMFSQPQLFICN